MKCGLICARSARTSARANRAREVSSSASASWAGDPAGGLHAWPAPGRARPAARTARRARRLAPPSGGPAARPPRRGPRSRRGRRSGRGSRARSSGRRPPPSPRPPPTGPVVFAGAVEGEHASRASLIAKPAAPVRVRRWRTALAAPASVSPSRSGSAASAGDVQYLVGGPLGGGGDPAAAAQPHDRVDGADQRGEQRENRERGGHGLILPVRAHRRIELVGALAAEDDADRCATWMCRSSTSDQLST